MNINKNNLKDLDLNFLFQSAYLEGIKYVINRTIRELFKANKKLKEESGKSSNKESQYKINREIRDLFAIRKVLINVQATNKLNKAIVSITFDALKNNLKGKEL